MSSNPFYPGANAFACTKANLTNERHRLTCASGLSSIRECQFSGVGLDITHAVNCTSTLTVEKSGILNSTILTAGALYIERSSFQRCRISAAETIKFDYSYLRQTYLRMQPGTGLDMVNNDVDELHIEGSDTFSHLFNLNGLFIRCRFKGLKIFDGNVKAIFYKTLWKDTLIRESVFINTIFNHCIMNKVVFRDCVFLNVTVSSCDLPDGPVIFQGCDFKIIRLTGLQASDCLFLNCTGLMTVSFDT